MSQSFLDAEAGGRMLFDLTFEGTLPLLPTWEQQPEAFREDFRRKAVAVAVACDPDPAYAQAHA
jgi:hypothetical protein